MLREPGSAKFPVPSATSAIPQKYRCDVYEVLAGTADRDQSRALRSATTQDFHGKVPVVASSSKNKTKGRTYENNQ
jgi:hypothetical protein